MDARNGAAVIDLLPNGVYYAGSNPFSQWQSYQLWPGGNPAFSVPSATRAVAYVADSVQGNGVRPGAPNGSTIYDYTRSLIGIAGSTPPNNDSLLFLGGGAAYTSVGDDRYSTNAAITQVAFLSGVINLGSGHGLSTGQDVVYRKGAASNSAVGGLVDGQTYYVIADGARVRLALTSSDAHRGNALLLQTSGSVGTGTGHSLTRGGVSRTFNPQSAVSQSSSVSGAYQLGSGGPDGDLGYFAYVPRVSTAELIRDYPASITNPTTTSTAIYGGQVVIRAKTIDINAEIQAGQPTNWSLNLSPALGTKLATIRSQYQAGARSNPLYIIPLSELGIVTAGDSQITATYNAQTNQITVDNVLASSEGSSVYINGAIISTNTLGKITVQGGPGKVTVNNQTGIAVVVKDVYAGKSLGAEAAPSKVEIIDTNLPAAERHSLYLYEPGVGIAVYTGSAEQTLGTGTPSSLIAGGSTSYQPRDGMRWEWEQQASLSRGLNASQSYSLTNWGWSFPAGQPNNPWRYRNPTTGSLESTPVGQIVDDLAYLDEYAFYTSVTSTYAVGAIWEIRYHDGNYDFHDNENGEFPGYPEDESPWFFHFVTSATLTQTSSVKADNAIGIRFTGLTAGSIDITSNADVILSGQLSNPSGDTTITVTGPQHQITQTATASSTSIDLTLQATDSVGTAAQAIAAGLMTDGVLKATSASAGVYLNLNSAAIIDTVSAGTAGGYSDVQITAAGDLLRHPSAPSATVNVSGNNITLSSTLGAIGEVDNPLIVDTHGAAQANGSVVGGVLNATALNDIALTEASGDLRIGAVRSTSGVVALNVPDGRIVNASETTAASLLTQAELERIWTALGLLSTSKSREAVEQYQLQVRTRYEQYWQLLSRGRVEGGLFTLDDSALALYAAQAGAELDVATPTGAQIQAYAAERYEELLSFFDLNFDPLYWELLANGIVVNHVFTLNTGSVSSFRVRAGADLGVVNPSDAQVRTWAASKYLAIVSGANPNRSWRTQSAFNASATAVQSGTTTEESAVVTGLNTAGLSAGMSVSGTGIPVGATVLSIDGPSQLTLSTSATSSGQSVLTFSNYDANYLYTATQFQKDALTQGGIWTQGELTHAINLTALNPSSGTSVGTGTPNIVAATIALSSADDIGQRVAPTTISTSALSAGTLTTVQAQALAAAVSPGDVKLIGTNSAGQTITVSYGQEPAGFVATAVEVAVTAPLFVAATARLDALTGESLYLQSTSPSLPLGLVQARGEVSLASPGSIGVSTTAGAQDTTFTFQSSGAALTRGHFTRFGFFASPGYLHISGGETQGLLVGMSVRGPGIHPEAVVTAISGSRVDLSIPPGFGSGDYTFSPRMSHNSSVVSGVDTQGLSAGMVVSGSHIPIGTVIASIDSATQLTLSNPVILGAVINTSGTVTLAAGNGDITAPTDASLAVYSREGHLAASAGGNLRVRQVAGNLTLDRFFAGGHARIDVPTGNLSTAPGTVLSSQGLELQIDGSAGTADTPLAIQLGTGMLSGTVGSHAYFHSTEEFTATGFATSTGDITITVSAEDVVLSQVTTPGTLTVEAAAGSVRLDRVVANTIGIEAQQHILADSSTGAAVTATTIQLAAATGSIGSPARALTLHHNHGGSGVVSAVASGTIYLDAVSSGLRLQQIDSGTGVVFIAAQHTIVGRADGVRAIDAETIHLTSRGAGVGQITVGSTTVGAVELTATAQTGIDVTEDTGPLHVRNVSTSNGDVTLTVTAGATGDRYLIMENGDRINTMHGDADRVTLNVGDGVRLAAGSTIYGSQRVLINGQFNNNFTLAEPTEFTFAGTIKGFSQTSLTPDVGVNAPRGNALINLLGLMDVNSQGTTQLRAANSTINVAPGALDVRGNLDLPAFSGGTLNLSLLSDTQPRRVTVTDQLIDIQGTNPDDFTSHRVTFSSSGVAQPSLIHLQGSGSAVNTFDVQSVREGDTVSLIGGSANDAFQVFDDNQTLDGIRGNLAIDAGGGAANRLIVDSQGTVLPTLTQSEIVNPARQETTHQIFTSRQQVTTDTRFLAPGMAVDGFPSGFYLPLGTTILSINPQASEVTLSNFPQVSPQGGGTTVLVYGPNVRSHTRTVTGVFASNLMVGMAVSGTGIPVGTTIASIDGPYTITLSETPTANGPTALTFGAALRLNSNVLEAVNPAGLEPGMLVSGDGIPTGTVIQAIDAVNKRITLTESATRTGPTALTFTATVTAILSSKALFGLAPGRISYQATGGHFTGASADGILIYAPLTGATAFNVRGTLEGSTTKIVTGAGADTINVSSDAPVNTGVVAGVRGLLSIDAGAGSNRLLVSDQGNLNPSPVPPVVTSSSITGLAPAGIDFTATAGTITALIRDRAAATSPTATIARAGATTDLFNAPSADFTVTFSKPVTGVSAGDFVVTFDGVPVPFPVTVTGSGLSYTVTVNQILRPGNGALGLRLVDSNTIRDAFDNPVAPSTFTTSFQAGVPLDASVSAFLDAPEILGAVDIDSDAIADLIVHNRGDRTVVVLRSERGVFTSAGVGVVASAADVVQLGDVNTDGTPDLVIVTAATNTLRVLTGNGDGTFVLAQTLTLANAPTAVAVGAIDGDANPDLAVLHSGGGVGILTGSGNGSFVSAGSVVARAGSGTIRLADTNQDGKADLIFTGDSSWLDVRLGIGEGTFAPPQEVIATGIGTGSLLLTTADLNDDGILDAVIRRSDNALNVLLGQGDGSFVVGQSFHPGVVAGSVTVGDINRDGTPDLLVGSANGTQISLSLGNGDGSVGAPLLISAGSSPATVALGDLNGDRRADVIGGNLTSDTVNLLFANPTVTITGQTYNYHEVAPSVVSIRRHNPASPRTAANGLTWRVIFDYPVTGVDTTDFIFDVNGVAPLHEPQVSGSGTTYDVSVVLDAVNRSFLEGTIGLNLVDDDSIHNLVGTPLGAAGAAGNGSLTGAVYTYDHIAPEFVSIRRSQEDQTLVSPDSASFVLTFNEPVTGIVASTFQLVLGGTVQANGPVTLSGGGTTWTATFTGITGTGTLGVVFRGSSDIRDLGGFPLQSWPQGSFPGQAYYNIVQVLPFVRSITRSGPSATLDNATTALFAVTFSETVFGVDASDFEWAGTGSVTASALQVSGSGSSYTVTVSGVSGNGTLGLRVLGDGSIVDAENNPLTLPQLSYEIDPAYPFNPAPSAAAVADVNADGIPDLIGTDGASNKVGIRLGNGDGSFQDPFLYALLVPGAGGGIGPEADLGAGPFDLEVADLNADGRLDLAVATIGLNGGVVLLLGNGDGTFQNPSALRGSHAPSAGTAGLAVVDLNADGRFDLVASNYNLDNISVRLGRGDGTFGGLQEFATGNGPFALEAADLNGDGRPDVVTADRYSSTLSVLYGNGDGTFQAARQLSAGTSTRNLASADLNGDGRADLVAVNYGPDFFEDGSATVLLNDGSGGFTATEIPLGRNPRGAALADFNRDGHPDLFVAQAFDVSVALGRGDGTFQTPAAVDLEANIPVFVAAADTNGDGDRDVVLATGWNYPQALVVARGNGDGTFRRQPASFAGPAYTVQSYPVVAALAPAQTPALSNAGSVSFHVTFSKPVSGVDPADFALVPTGTVLASAIRVAGSGDTYTVTVSGITGNGTLGLSLVDNDSILGQQGDHIALGGTGTDNGSFTGSGYTIDQVAPAVVSINRAAPSPTHATSVTFTVAFSEAVEGVDAGDFSLALGGVTASTPVVVSGTGTTYTVTVNGITGTGTVGLNLIDNQSIHDPAGNPLRSGGNPSFATAENLASSSADLVSADVDGDGHVDLVLTTGVMLGQGDGTFGGLLGFSGIGDSSAVEVADFNADGDLDVAVANPSSNTVSVLLGQGDGTFQAATTYPVGSTPTDVLATDLNGDGKPDLVTVNRGDRTISVLFGSGDGTFTAGPGRYAGGPPISAATGDLNGDGRPDLVVGRLYSRDALALLSNGDGTFQQSATMPTGGYSRAVQLADINGDGERDVVVGNEAHNNVTVALGHGDGTFAASTTFPAGVGFLVGVAVADLNRDGSADLLLADHHHGQVRLLAGNGDGTFGATALLATAPGTSNLAVADFNGDGRPDLAALNATSLSLLFNDDSGKFTGQVYDIDQTNPTVASIDRAGASAVTSATSVAFTVTFSEAVTGVDASDFALALNGVTVNSLPSVSGSGHIYTVTVSDILGEGTVGLNLVDNDSILDSAGNALSGAGNGNFTGQTYTIERGAPTVAAISRGTPNAGLTNASSVAFTVIFSEAVSGVDASDFSLALNGVTATTPVSVSGSGSTYTVMVSGISGDGTLGLNLIDDDSIFDQVGSSLGGTGGGNGNFTGQSYTIDQTAPVVVSFLRVSASPTNATSVAFTVVFSEPVTGVDTGDFPLELEGVTVDTPVSVTGSGTTYTLTVSGIVGEGNVRPDLSDDETIFDLAGNSLGGAGPHNGDFNGPRYIVDHTAPAVTSIVRAGASPTNANSVVFTVTFSEAVSGVDASDFTLALNGVTATTPVVVSGSGSTYTVTVSGISGSGTLGLNLIDDDSVTDRASNALGGAGAGNGGFTGQSYTVDQTVPTVVSINRASASPTSATSVAFTVTFSEAVTGVDAGDFTLALNGVTTATPVVVSGGGGTYTVTVGGVSGNGTLALNLVDDDSILDRVGHALSGPGAANGDFAGQTYAVDQSAAAVASIDRAGASPTNAAGVAFTVRFSEAVTGVDAGDFALALSGVTAATAVSVAGSGATYTVTVSGLGGAGTVGLDLVDNDSIRDLAGNALGGAGLANGNFSGAVYSIDRIAPTVASISRVSASPTNADSVAFTVSFSEAVTGVDAADFALALNGVSATTPVVVSGSGSTYTVTVSGVSGDGTLGLNLVDDDSILDLVGNSLGTTSFTGPTYTIDQTVPRVVAISRADDSPTTATIVSFTVTFSEAVTGVDASDFALAATGVSTLTPVIVSGSGLTYTVTVIGVSGTGTLGLNLSDDDSIVDRAGNLLGGSGTSDFIGESYTIDQTPPVVVAIERDSTSPTDASSVAFTVRFNEAVTGVDATDFTLVLNGVTTATPVAISGSGNSYTVTVSGISGNGTLGLNLVDDDSIVDQVSHVLGGRGTDNGDFTGQTYTIDQDAPTVLGITRTSAALTNATSVAFTVTFSEAVTGVEASDFALALGGVTASLPVVTGSGSSYTVIVNGISGDGTLGLDLRDDDSIRDLAGNTLGGSGAGNGDFTGQTLVIDQTPPQVVSLVRTSASPTGVSSVSFAVTFSEIVQGVDPSDFELVLREVTASSSILVSGSGASYVVTVHDIVGNGSLGLNLIDDDSIRDQAGNALGGAGAGNGDRVGEVYDIEQVPPNDTLVGPDTVNTWLITGPGQVTLNGVGYTGVRHLVGGSLADTFRFLPGGNLAGTIDGGAGMNTLDYAALTTGVSVNLAQGRATGTAGVSRVRNLVGGAGDDLLIGDEQNNELTGGAGNDMLQGGGGDDTYLFNTDTPLGRDVLEDSSGRDHVDFSATTRFGVRVDLGDTAFQVINSHLTLRLIPNLPIENVTGTNQDDTLLGNATANVLRGLGGNDTIRSREGDDEVIVGDGNTAIWTDGGNDSVSAGNGANEIHAGQGTNTIVVGHGHNHIWTSGGIDWITAGDGNNEIHSSGAQDTIVVGDGDNRIWTNGGDDTITAGHGNNYINAGSANNTIVVGRGNNRIVTRGGQDSITVVGDGNNDIQAGSSDNTITIAGHGHNVVRTGGGVDRLYLTGNGNNTLELGGGNDIVLIAGTGNNFIDAGAGDDVVFAGDGNDTVTGRGGNDILIGGSGDDLIVGSSGKDMLIGGWGSDRLVGDAGEDILVAGRTSYDGNVTALQAIMAEWCSDHSYLDRVQNILGISTNRATSFAQRHNDGYFLIGDDASGGLGNQTVFSDTSVDTLTGGANLDWYFANTSGGSGEARDVITDLSRGETASDIDPNLL